MREAYTTFAQVYDEFMDNVPYEEWSQVLLTLLKKHGCAEGILLDLACGTGKMTEILAKQGYDMIGVDASEDMLNIAMEKQAAHQPANPATTSAAEEAARQAATPETSAEQTGSSTASSILYLLQDMREFELYGTVAGVVCLCDSLNYLTEKEDLVQVFKLVNNYLDPGAPFIFDFNPVYKYKNLLGEQTFAENREDASFIWDNYYDPEEKINEYDLTLFIREEDGRFSRFEETHYQRAYTLKEAKDALKEAGMTFVEAFDGYTNAPPTRTSERILVVAREKGKLPAR